MPTVVNPLEYKSYIGLKNLYVAAVLQDDNTAYLPDTPEPLAPACEAAITPKVAYKEQFADNYPYDPLVVEGDTEIKLKVTSIPIMLQAKILGKQADLTTGRVYDNGGIPPYYALMFESLRADGQSRYYAYLKGRFMAPPEAYASKADTPDPKIPEITFYAAKTIYQFNLGSVTDGCKRVIGDQDVLNFSPTNWYTAVQVPQIGSIVAPALNSSVPTAGATGVSVSTAITLTFNNPMALNAEKHCMLINGTTYAVIATTNTINATRKIITLTPTGNLTAATTYTVVMPVLDLYGQVLDAAFKFNT